MAITIDGAGTITGLNADGISSQPVFAGQVLQVVQIVSDTNTTTTSSSFTDATGLSASITPTSVLNKILVLCDLQVQIRSNDLTVGGLRIVRDATTVHIDDRASELGVNASINATSHNSFNYLDSPASAASITYKIQLRRVASAGASLPFVINELGGKSTITLMEIAG